MATFERKPSLELNNLIELNGKDGHFSPPVFSTYLPYIVFEVSIYFAAHIVYFFVLLFSLIRRTPPFAVVVVVTLRALLFLTLKNAGLLSFCC